MDTYQPSLLVLSILFPHSWGRYYLISPSTRQRRKIKETYTQTPSLPSLFLTFNWKIPLVYPFSPTIWPTHALARVDRWPSWLCPSLSCRPSSRRLLRESYISVVGRTRLTANTSLVCSSADVLDEDATQVAYLESIFFDVCHCFLFI
jgi:hypothetical protein